MTGATLGIAKRFSVSRFWESPTPSVTLFLAVGSMASALVARKPGSRPSTRFGGHRRADHARVYDYFEDELDIRCCSSTGRQADGVVFCTLDKSTSGSAGWACAFDVRIVDEHDEPVPVGEVGRLLYHRRGPHDDHSTGARPDAAAESTGTCGGTPATWRGRRGRLPLLRGRLRQHPSPRRGISAWGWRPPCATSTGFGHRRHPRARRDRRRGRGEGLHRPQEASSGRGLPRPARSSSRPPSRASSSWSETTWRGPGTIAVRAPSAA